jgi:D-alanyl-D-alanine carboxypeptidase (penicillin-binding protein 5/6)
MQLKKIRFFIFSLVLLPIGFLFANLPPLPTPAPVIPAPPAIAAKSYILMDYLSDYVIVEQDVDQRVEPASLTKMMTVFVVDNALKNGKIKLTDMVKISETAWRTQGSRMFVDLNSEVSVEDLLRGVIIQSGNDASVALAEYVGGTEGQFAEMMNFYAKALGMVNSHFVNATGLPDPNHFTTARDMAILAKNIIRDFPNSYSMYAQKEFTFKNIKQQNRNRLLWKDDSVDGIKTGHTDTAGYCLVASGQRNGMRLISVVMGAKSDKIRTDETSKLLSYGFQFYETRKLYPALTPVKQARIWMGKEKELNLGLQEDMYVTIGRGQYDRLKANIDVQNDIKAPVANGAVLGTIAVQLEDKTIAERPIIALNAVEQANIFRRMYDQIALRLQNLWNKVMN